MFPSKQPVHLKTDCRLARLSISYQDPNGPGELYHAITANQVANTLICYTRQLELFLYLTRALLCYWGFGTCSIQIGLQIVPACRLAPFGEVISQPKESTCNDTKLPPIQWWSPES